MCNHCDNAPCIRAARGGAVSKRPDGLVVIDPERARGQKQIAQACPYGAAVWNQTEQVAQIWGFDAHLLDRGWKEPRCVQACATEAMQTVKISDETMAARVTADGLSPLRPDLNTKPRVWYRNLDRVRRHFAAGHVETELAGVRDCAPDLEVSLYQGNRRIAAGRTDVYGDFKLDGIDPKGASCHLMIGEARFDIDPTLNTVLSDLVMRDGVIGPAR
jgi:nitrate reductase beta subunit